MNDTTTATICENMALYSRNCITEAPDIGQCEIATHEMMGILEGVFTHSCMEQDIEDMLWQLVNLFHRKAAHLELLLDANVQKQKTLLKQQDGSDIQSVELETATEEGRAIETRLQVVQAMREAGAERFSCITGSIWLPKSGSRARGRALTAGVVDSKDFIRARHLQKTSMVIPDGKRVAIAPGKSTDHAKIWYVLDQVLEKFRKHGDTLVLLHGGSAGVETIAALWAENRKVQQVVFRPDWNKHHNAAPFKRNDAILEEFPVGLVVIAEDEKNGIQQQLIRNARKMSVAIYRP